MSQSTRGGATSLGRRARKAAAARATGPRLPFSAVTLVVACVAFGLLLFAAGVHAEGDSVIRRPIAVDFDGQNAYEHVEKLVSFGARSVGSPGHAKAVDYIAATLKSYGLEPELMKFTADTPDGKFEMTNIIATIGPPLGSPDAAPTSGTPAAGGTPSPSVFPSTPTIVLPPADADTVVLCAHYDTKRFPFTFVGANDGGSGTAALLELARVLSARRPTRRVVLVFFDGEEAFGEWTDTDSLYGSRKLAETWKKSGVTSKIRALILMDMIGDKDLGFKRESTSSRWLQNRLWQQAAAQGRRSYFSDDSLAIEDDHKPFIEAGVPAAVLIDLQFGPNGTNTYWHTAQDTLDKVSANSLQIVGRVVEGTTREF